MRYGKKLPYVGKIFAVTNGVITGFFDKNAKAKKEQNPDILVLFEEDLREILQYVSTKYGNKFWETLYE